MANDSDSGLGWLVAIGLGAYLAYSHWWKEPDTPQKQGPIKTADISYPTGALAVLDNGTEWRMVWTKLKGPRDNRLAWVREDHSNNKKRKARETLALYKIDCNTTGYVTLSIVDYDKEGKVIETWNEFTDKPSFPPPGSIIENVVEGACLPQFGNISASSINQSK